MVTKYYPPVSHGGTEKYIEIISQRLVENGLHVTIAGPSPSRHITYQEDKGVVVYRFPIHKIRPIEFSHQMKNLINASSYDIVHFHTFESLCRFLRIGLRKPYVISTHGFTWEEPNILSPARYFFRLKVLRKNFQEASQIFCVSEEDRKSVARMLRHKPDTLHYLPPGVDVQSFSNMNKNSLKMKLGMGGKIIICQVARFTNQKGQHVLLRALEKMPKVVRTKCVTFLAGHVFDNSYFLEIERSIRRAGLEKEVIPLPNINDDQIRGLYGAADIFVLPSLVEGLPLTLLEAWASKCAAIVTAVGGIPYIVRNGIDGIVVSPNDSLSLSEEIRKLILDERERMSLSESGFEKVKREFDLDKTARFLTEKYREILEN